MKCQDCKKFGFVLEIVNLFSRETGQCVVCSAPVKDCERDMRNICIGQMCRNILAGKADGVPTHDRMEYHLFEIHRLLIESFGPGTEVGFMIDAGGKLCITVACQGCKSINRLQRGLQGAICGVCSKSLTNVKAAIAPQEKTVVAGVAN